MSSDQDTWGGGKVTYPDTTNIPGQAPVQPGVSQPYPGENK
jgi:hypothetical protein